MTKTEDIAALDDWRTRLHSGKVKGTLRNAMIALREAPVWHGVLAFDEFAVAIKVMSAPPWERGSHNS